MIMRRFYCVLLFVFATTAVFSHPHIGIDVAIEAHTNDGILEGIEVTWLFDKAAYAREILADYDPDGNDVLSKHEIERLRLEAFDAVYNHSYFLFLMADDAEVITPEAERFSAQLSGDHLVYTFFLPYNYRYEVSSDSRLKRFTFTLKDPTGYMEVKLSQFDASSPSQNISIYQVYERWEEFLFVHGEAYSSEMLVQDILFFPPRG
jgi:ABC-type uncharacterized transport system substrate-binding protein